jgi:hypothetical protein
LGVPGIGLHLDLWEIVELPVRHLHRNTSTRAWLRSAVFTLDRWLRKRQAIYEYSKHPCCLFRVQCVRVDAALKLADGTSVRAGSRVLALHLWNEHVPSMGSEGPTVAWARRTSRAIHTSLKELARYLAAQPALSDVAVICADMRIRGTGQAERLARVTARYGFETSAGTVDSRGLLHRMGDGLLIMLLVTVTNPPALRSSVLRHDNLRLFLSRAVLEKRYGGSSVRPRSAAVTGTRPARTAGNTPPMSPIASAHPMPISPSPGATSSWKL